MAKLYFRYGAMNSGKTTALIQVAHNYEERGMNVLLLKPSADSRDGKGVIRSRVGLQSEAEVATPERDIKELFRSFGGADAIIADESQFFTPEQIDQLRDLVDDENVPVLCFGLRTDFLTKTFPGSARLLEVADSITEIKTICSCGAKATVNARIDPEGSIVTHGQQVFLGGNDSYIAM